MTKLLEKAIEAVRKLPEKRQDELADVLLAEVSERSYTQEQLDAIDEGIADADAGRFASDEQMTALFAKYSHTA